MTGDTLTVEEVRRLNRGQQVSDEYHRAVSHLAAGRVEIITKTHRVLEAEVIGSQGERRYITGDLDGIRCSCPAWHHRHRCAHLDAVKLVTAGPGLRRLPPATNTTPGSFSTRGHPNDPHPTRQVAYKPGDIA